MMRGVCPSRRTVRLKKWALRHSGSQNALMHINRARVCDSLARGIAVLAIDQLPRVTTRLVCQSSDQKHRARGEQRRKRQGDNPAENDLAEFSAIELPRYKTRAAN